MQIVVSNFNITIPIPNLHLINTLSEKQIITEYDVVNTLLSL